MSGESSDKSAHRTVEQPHTGEHLARVAALGWPAVETEELGGWLLQASDGFTGRANCVVPTGDPGLALDAALDRVRAFYRRRGLPALIQVVVGSPLEAALCDRGWRARASGKSPHASVDVQVTTLATMLAAAGHAGGRSSVGPVGSVGLRSSVGPADSVGPAGAGGSDEAVGSEGLVEVELTRVVDEPWMRLYGRGPGPATAAARHVLASPELVAFARIRNADGDDLAGIGRGVVTGPWLGISAVEVAAPWRRRGWGRALMSRLGHWGGDQGSTWIYLQVGSDNTPALRMYKRLGFRTDHQYRYYTPSSPA